MELLSSKNGAICTLEANRQVPSSLISTCVMKTLLTNSDDGTQKLLQSIRQVHYSYLYISFTFSNKTFGWMGFYSCTLFSSGDWIKIHSFEQLFGYRDALDNQANSCMMNYLFYLIVSLHNFRFLEFKIRFKTSSFFHIILNSLTLFWSSF